MPCHKSAGTKPPSKSLIHTLLWKKEISRGLFFVCNPEALSLSSEAACPRVAMAADGHIEWFEMLISQAPAGPGLGIEYWWNIVSVDCNTILSKWLHANWEIPTQWICSFPVEEKWVILLHGQIVLCLSLGFCEVSYRSQSWLTCVAGVLTFSRMAKAIFFSIKFLEY